MKVKEWMRSRSLLSRYLLIIATAVLFIPVIIPLTLIGYGVFSAMNNEDLPKEYEPYTSISALETMWHQEALGLDGASAEAVGRRLQELSGQYDRAAMFWVDGAGGTRLVLPWREGPEAREIPVIPQRWSAAEAIAFMKSSAKLEPLAIVAFIGDRADAGEGFMVMQIPEYLRDDVQLYSGLESWYMVMLLLFFVLFILISLLFFNGIRRRLLRLQTAMAFGGEDGLPQPIAPGKPDEIGRLEDAFNTMIAELTASRQREAEEEGLRRRLVADLSHDLRTPLTVIRSHLHVLGKEEVSPRGKESLQLMDERIEGLSLLIENLLSYNLLSSGKMQLSLERRDVLRLARAGAAAWYPLWEKEGFTADIDLEGEPLYWNVDESWFRRILDNLFQNILRHARSGRYVGVAAEVREGRRVLVISDHGAGMGQSTEAKGAGLGLAIVDLLLKRMELDWKAESSGQGTEIVIYRPL
ncbi:sensor histidine kinase ['Paenibacillus yunnanensis' Narsing Rao et al. 2020]|uniref:sensor histidine kinase n=1 Tax=Paenibacillus tengchongensis TaxID=2608684 RepID=UPI00124D6E76|nr:HAMP domain-containing sensor histidine kinase [Paenibacillus tengchongensis]